MERASRKRTCLIGCLVAVALVAAGLLAGAIAIGVLIEMHYIPDTEVASADELHERVVSKLVGHGIVERDERVLYFYSDGFLSHLEDGNLFTDRRVISYVKEDGELLVWAATYPEIEDLRTTWNEGWLENSVVEVHTVEGEVFSLLVSNEGGRDEEFVERLMQTWETERAGEHGK